MTSRSTRVITRSLTLADIPALLELEHRQWTPEQSATADDFRARINAHPELCNGAFDARTGQLLASLFCKPTYDEEWVQPKEWKACAALDDSIVTRAKHRRPRALFGISLTSVDGRAALQLIAFQFMFAVRAGLHFAYLGSPMPGWSRHRNAHPQAGLEQYARTTRQGLPLDPQLRYYHGKGFREIVAVREDYFPHAASQDAAAILRARVPLVWLRPVVRLLPVRALHRIAALVPHKALPAQ